MAPVAIDVPLWEPMTLASSMWSEGRGDRVDNTAQAETDTGFKTQRASISMAFTREGDWRRRSEVGRFEAFGSPCRRAHVRR